MSRTLHWNDDYCPKGHRWQFVPSSGLFPDYYYCAHDDCDRFWEPTVEIVEDSEIATRFNADRPQKMRDMANFLTWRESLTPKDWRLATPPIKGKE